MTTPPITWAQVSRHALDSKIPKVFMPRRYIPAPGYANPACISLSCYSGFLRAEHHEINEVDAAVLSLELNLVNHCLPTYFVSQAFVEAATATKLPDLIFDEVNWPAQALLFCLPLELSKRYFGHEVPFILVSRLPEGEIKLQGRRVGAGVGTKASVVIAAAPILLPSGDCVMYHQTRPLSHKLDSLSRTVQMEHGELFIFDEYPKIQGEEDLSRLVSELAIKLVLLMGAAPEHVEAGSIVRQAKVKRGLTVQDELWSPNFLGRTYQHPGAALGGTHASPRVHFRRGHLHTVLHGPGKEKSRLQWFQPVWVNL